MTYSYKFMYKNLNCSFASTEKQDILTDSFG